MFIALALALSVAAADATRLYVAADVLRVRSAPETAAPAVGRLRIGAECRVLDRRAEWARVDCGAVGGWVAAAHLRERPIGLEEAVAEAAKATGKARWEWLERVVALDASRAGAWARLADAYAADERTDKERHVRELIAGRLPLYLAACGRVQVHFATGRSRGRELVTIREVADPEAGDVQASSEWRRLADMASALSGIAWWPASGEPVGLRVDGPRVDSDAEGCEPGAELTLGIGGPDCGPKAPLRSSILASIPVTPLATGPEEPRGRALAMDFLARKKQSPDVLVIRRLQSEPSLWAVRWVSKGTTPTSPVIGGVAVLDGIGAARADVAVELAGMAERRSLEELTWFSAGGLRVGVAPFYSEQELQSENEPSEKIAHEDYGFVVVVVEADGKVSATTIYVRQVRGGGC